LRPFSIGEPTIEETAKEAGITIDETRRAGDVDLARRITASRGDIVVKLVVDEYKAISE